MAESDAIRDCVAAPRERGGTNIASVFGFVFLTQIGDSRPHGARVLFYEAD